MANAQAAVAAPARPATPEPGRPDTPERPQKTYELTDPQGRRTLVWWEPAGWVVEADDPGFRRRVKLALRRSLWVREDTDWPDGIRSSSLVELQPPDPRYANRLRWNWAQLELDDVAVRVVALQSPVQLAGA